MEVDKAQRGLVAKKNPRAATTTMQVHLTAANSPVKTQFVLGQKDTHDDIYSRQTPSSGNFRKTVTFITKRRASLGVKQGNELEPTSTSAAEFPIALKGLLSLRVTFQEDMGGCNGMEESLATPKPLSYASSERRTPQTLSASLDSMNPEAVTSWGKT